MKNIEIDWPETERWRYSAGGNYQPLNRIRVGDTGQTLTFVWAPSWRDRLRMLFGERLFVSVMTFGKPLQPLRVDVGEPEFVAEHRKYARIVEAAEDTRIGR